MAGAKSRMPKSLSHHGSLTGQTNSASLAKAERKIKVLEEENSVLKEELSDIRSMYRQLITEATHESFDERRVNLLKTQIIQLERQILIQNESLGARSEVLLEVENAVDSVADCCRSYLAQQDKVGSVTVNKHDLKTMLDISESTGLKLSKTVENTATEKLKKPLLFMDKFVKHNPWEPVTLMDVCSGKIEHLSLKHVAKLESQLAQLYKGLSSVQQSLQSINPGCAGKPANKHVPQLIYQHLGEQVTQVNDRLKDVTADLLELAILVPSAPWPPLNRPAVRDLTIDNVMERLPNFHKSKLAEVREQISSMLKSMNYTVYMAKLESQCLKDEVKFHQNLYQIQLEYIDKIADSLRDGYITFEENTHEMVCVPMKEVFNAYSVLKQSASEDALRHFLSVFRKHADDMSISLERISAAFQDNSAVDNVMRSYREEYQLNMNKIHEDCTRNRDDLAAKLSTARTNVKETSEDPNLEITSEKGEFINNGVRGDSMDLVIPTENLPSDNSNSNGKWINTTLRLPPEKLADDRKSSLENRPPWDNVIIEPIPSARSNKREKLSPGKERKINPSERPAWDDTAVYSPRSVTREDEGTPGRRSTDRAPGVENRPPWETSLAAEGSGEECTCGAEDLASPRRRDSDEVSDRSQSLPPRKPPNSKSSKKKKTPSTPRTKPADGVPQSRLVLKPKKQSSIDGPSPGTPELRNNRQTLSPIRRSGSLSTLSRENSSAQLLERGNSPSDRHRQSAARERRAESLNRSVAAALSSPSANNLEQLYPAQSTSSSLKNSLGLDKPWK